MVYCTAAQVKMIVNTDMADASITELIAENDAEMDLTLPTGSMSATIKQMISRRKTALDVMLKDPNSMGIGEFREDRARTMEMLRDRVERLERAIEGGITFVVGYENLTDELNPG